MKKSYLHRHQPCTSRERTQRKAEGEEEEGEETHDASWLAFINTARNTFGPTPRASEPTPSSRTIYTARESDARVGAEHARRTFRATITITTENIK